MEEFILNDELIELAKLIKVIGWAETGGHAKQLIKQGEVMVNGDIEYRKRTKLRKGDVVTVAGRKVLIASPGE